MKVYGNVNNILLNSVFSKKRILMRKMAKFIVFQIYLVPSLVEHSRILQAVSVFSLLKYIVLCIKKTWPHSDMNLVKGSTFIFRYL